MSRLKVGTHVKLTKKYLKWISENADDLYAYPRLFNPDTLRPWGEIESLADQLTEYFMDRYSHDRCLEIHGVIIGYNEYSDDDFAYLVWYGNELGESTHYVSQESLKVVK